MTFATLTRIHRLLTTEEARTNELYKASRKNLEELKASNADKASRKEAEKAMETHDLIHMGAYRALCDFEAQDWR